MNQKEFLKKNNIPSIEYPDEEFNKLKEQFLEMAQIKSDFDIEKFTVKREGSFIAHNFHFLMRQYSLALFELRRMYLEKEEKLRKIKEYTYKINQNVSTIIIENEKKYLDIEIKKLMNEIDLLDLSITNKLIMCDRFEKARKKLIELNNNEPITNKQYQAEEPQYWKWFLQRKALNEMKQRGSGITEGVWENIDFLEEPALINDNFQVKVTDEKGLLNLDDARKNILEKKKKVKRIK